MKSKKAIYIVVILLMFLIAFPAYARGVTESETIEELRKSESLVLVEIISCEVDYDNRSWIEDQGDLCNVKLRLIKTIFGKKKTTGIYTLRGYFDEQSMYKKMIVDMREPTKKEKTTRNMKPCAGSISYDAGQYVLGFTKIPLITAENGSTGFYHRWAEPDHIISEKNLIAMLNGSIATNDLEELPGEYDAICDGRLWDGGGLDGELAFEQITTPTYIYAKPDKKSKKILTLRSNNRVVVYRRVEDPQWSNVLYENGKKGYIMSKHSKYTTPGTKPYSVKEIRLAKVTKTGNMYDLNYFLLSGATVQKGTTVVIGEQAIHAEKKYYRILGGPQAIAYIPADCVTPINNITLGTVRPLVHWAYDVAE